MIIQTVTNVSVTVSLIPMNKVTPFVNSTIIWWKDRLFRYGNHPFNNVNLSCNKTFVASRSFCRIKKIEIGGRGILLFFRSLCTKDDLSIGSKYWENMKTLMGMSGKMFFFLVDKTKGSFSSFIILSATWSYLPIFPCNFFLKNRIPQILLRHTNCRLLTTTRTE